jgi:hypothetical protein
MKTLVHIALVLLVVQPLIALPSTAGKASGSSDDPRTDSGNAAKCRTLTGKWRQAGDNSHMRKVMNKRDKVEKKMEKIGCPVPTA